MWFTALGIEMEFIADAKTVGIPWHNPTLIRRNKS
jgi:hypothetical protein